MNILTDKQYERLLIAERDDSKYELRIPIPADGYVMPSYYCNWRSHTQDWEIDQCAVDFCKQRGFDLWGDDE